MTTLIKVIQLIEHKMGKYKKPITAATSLEKDIGITGDDAAELLLEYGKTFTVDVSNLNLKIYFTPEGDSILPEIIRWFRGKKEVKQKELTVGDLEKGVLAGLLDEDVINA